MRNRLNCLRHHTVIRRDDKDHDIGHRSAPGTHQREGFMTRRIQERNVSVSYLNLVRPDMLGDSAVLLLDHVRFADRVEQRRLAVIDVPHDRHDRRPSHHLFRFGDFDGFEQHALLEGYEFGFGIKVLTDLLGQFFVEGMIDGGKDAAVHQLRDDVLGARVELLGDVLDRQVFRQGHAHELARRFRFGLRPGHRSPVHLPFDP